MMRKAIERGLRPAVWTALAALTMLAGGCRSGIQGKIVTLATEDEFNRAIQAKGPVLVDFFKDACPTCDIQEAELEKIVDDYKSQVSFVRFKVREPTMITSAPEVMQKHKLFWVPTVILFVNGQEVKRWELNHSEWEFREELNKILSPQPGGAVVPPAAPATGVPAPGGASAGPPAAPK